MHFMEVRYLRLVRKLRISIFVAMKQLAAKEIPVKTDERVIQIPEETAVLVLYFEFLWRVPMYNL